MTWWPVKWAVMLLLSRDCPENSDLASLQEVQNQKFICLLSVHLSVHKSQTAQTCPRRQDSGMESALALMPSVKGHCPEKLPCLFLGWPILVVYVTASDLWSLAFTSYPTSMRGCQCLPCLSYRWQPFLQDPIKHLYKYWKEPFYEVPMTQLHEIICRIILFVCI